MGEAIRLMYAIYDADPRVGGPDDFEAFRDAYKRIHDPIPDLPPMTRSELREAFRQADELLRPTAASGRREET